MYHISDLKKFSKCPRLYFLDAEAEKSFQPYLRSDESYVDLLKDKLKINECFFGKVGDSANKFFDAKDKYEWFINARFESGDLRIKAPFLHRLEDGQFDIYFLYYGTQIKDLDFFTYRITIEVLEKAGILIREIYVAHINPNYVYHGETKPDELFVITNKWHNGKIINMVLDSVIDYNDIINRIDGSNLDSLTPIKTRACHMKNICPYYDICFDDEVNLEDDSILTLASSQYKTTMYEEGIKTLKDVDVDKLEGNRVQYAQIMADRNGGLFVDKYNLKNWLSQIDRKPISFIDFEWDRYLIPTYEGMKPLDVIPFEFALYIDRGDKELEHKVFISSGDCRKEFIENILKEVPKEGKIFAYNATGAEILRLKELAEVYPEYKEELYDLINRFVDLATPFIEGIVYDIRMAGDYSLKKLVSVVSDKSYKDLDIDDGMEAVYRWRDIDKHEDVDENEIIENLKKYCSLDAYGLCLVYNWLKSLVK